MSPPVWAVLGDVLLCLGAGLLLGAARDAAELAFGCGRIRRFLWDLAAFAAAAFLCCGFAAGASASGTARWYMAAALGAGALCWRRCVSGALHGAARAAVRLAAWPLQTASARLARPVRERAGRWALARLRRKKQNKSPKPGKKAKNVLQKEEKVLYNG